MDIQSVFMRNLPKGITELDLRQQLSKLYGKEFPQLASKDLSITVFKPCANGLQQAELRNLALTQENMDRLKRFEAKIFWYQPKFYENHPQQRDEYGHVVVKLSAAERREYRDLHMDSVRNCLFVLDSSIQEELKSIYGGTNKVFLNLSPTKCIEEKLNQVATLSLFTCNTVTKQTVAVFSSALEALQCVTLFNNTKTLGAMTSFTDESGECSSKYAEGIGLGKSGTVLKIKDAVKVNGYVPIECFGSTIINQKQLLAKCKAVCWKCKTMFNIIGICQNLKFLAAKCEKCAYHGALKSAYCWPGESFTRMVPETGKASLDNEEINLRVVHRSMQISFRSVTEFVDLAFPLLQEEKFRSAAQFEKINTCTGILKSTKFIQRTVLKSKPRNLYGIHISVTTTDFWRSNNYLEIKKLHILMEFKNTANNQVIQVKVTGHVRGFGSGQDESGSTDLYITIHPAVGQIPLQGNVEVTAKHDNSEYKSIRHQINKWETKNHPSHLLNLLLLQHKGKNQWEIEKKDHMRLEKTASCEVELQLDKLYNDMNARQQDALTAAFKHKISMICGPPGTGKTMTAAAIIVTLSQKYNGHIIATAPSNVGADNIAEMVVNMFQRYHLNGTVLRMYSTNRQKTENEMKDKKQNHYDVLHELIQLEETWLNCEILQDIQKKIDDGQKYLLTREELDLYNNHIDDVELKVIKRYSVIVSTASSLSDMKAVELQKHIQISTLVIDESGQQTLPATASIIQCFAETTDRFVIVGDPHQLRATLLSQGAIIGGLGFSLMECEMKREKEGRPPWTNLNVQYRMAPQIRQLVSNLTYDGSLIDGHDVLQRPADLLKNIANAIPQSQKSSVVLYDHLWLEEKQVKNSTSFRNLKEAQYVCNLVQKLQSCGVAGDKITCLTMYEDQRRLINSILQESTINQLTQCLNVDAFQGQENDFVIVSFVRANCERDVGFIKLKNRLNVGLSRAKYLLLIVCNLQNYHPSKNQTISKFTKELLSVCEKVSLK